MSSIQFFLVLRSHFVHYFSHQIKGWRICRFQRDKKCVLSWRNYCLFVFNKILVTRSPYAIVHCVTFVRLIVSQILWQRRSLSRPTPAGLALHWNELHVSATLFPKKQMTLASFVIVVAVIRPEENQERHWRRSCLKYVLAICMHVGIAFVWSEYVYI